MDRKVAQRLGKRIREAREAKGLTQAQLADLAHKSIETISNFERGRRLPGVLTLGQLANRLGIRIGDLFDPEVPLVKADALTDRARLLSKDDRRIASEFVDFLIARRRRHVDH